MKLAFISDETFYQGSRGEWFATAAFPSEYIAAELPELTRFTVWVRRDIVAPAEEKGLFPVAIPVGVEFHVTGPVNQRSGPRGYAKSLTLNLPLLWRVARDNDVLWCKVPYLYPLLALRFAHKHSIRCVQVIGNVRESVRLLYPHLGWVAQWMDRQVRIAVRNATVAAFVSKALYREYGLLCRKSTVFHYGMMRREQLWLDRSLPHEPFRVLYVGRISAEKGLNFAILALAKLQGVELRVVGAGPFETDCRKLAISLGVDKRISWMGQLRWGESLFSEYREADALIVPSLTEGLPQVAVEALCHSLPIVATEVGGLPEIISSGENGLLVRSGDSDAIASAISELLRVPVWGQLVKGARRRAEEHTIELQMGRFLADVRRLWQAKQIA